MLLKNLIKAILATIGDIHEFDNLDLEIARIGSCTKYAPGKFMPVN